MSRRWVLVYDKISCTNDRLRGGVPEGRVGLVVCGWVWGRVMYNILVVMN